MTPWRWALSRASAICVAYSKTWSTGSRPFLKTLFQSVALDQFHHEEVNAVLFADVVECADVRMVQAAHSFGFTLEAFTALRVGGQLFGKNFDGHRSVQTRIGCAIHLSHPTGTDLFGDLVRTEFCIC